jgi:putative addiction module component (TIGR02574 family)
MKLLSDVTRDALELSPAQRLTLARILLDVSEPGQDFSREVEAAWEDEISRRIAKIKAGKARSKSFEDVFAELDRRFPS